MCLPETELFLLCRRWWSLQNGKTCVVLWRTFLGWSHSWLVSLCQRKSVSSCLLCLVVYVNTEEEDEDSHTDHEVRRERAHHLSPLSWRGLHPMK